MEKERNRIIAANIKKNIKEKGINQRELANKIGISPSTLSDYMNLRSNPSHGVIQKIADYFGILKSDIDTTYKESAQSDISKIYNKLESSRQKRVYSLAEKEWEEQKNNVVSFPVYGKTAAGTSPVTYGDPDVEHKDFSSVPTGADVALVVSGDSMEPIISDGSIVFYKRQPMVENGEIAIVEVEGDGVTCKRIRVDYENEKIILQSENDKYKDMVFSNDQIRILGKVLL